MPFSPPSGSVAWALNTTVPLAAPSETSAVAVPFSPLSKVGALSFMSPTSIESKTVPTARPRSSMPVTINGWCEFCSLSTAPETVTMPDELPMLNADVSFRTNEMFRLRALSESNM